MGHNGRPPVKASTLSPNLIDLSGARPMAACPECGWWACLRRGMIPPHRAGDGRTYPAGTTKPARPARCLGSGQRLILDLHPLQWRAQLDQAVRDAALRHSAHVPLKTAPPTLPAVHQIAAYR